MIVRLLLTMEAVCLSAVCFSLWVCVLGDCWHMLDQNIMVCIFVNTLNSIFMQLFWKKYLVVFVSLFPGVVAFRHVCVETCVPSYCSSKLYPSAAAL